MQQKLPEILSAISRELGHLAALTGTLQDQLSPRAYAGLDVEAFQSLDSLTQTLSCLTSYVADISALAQCQCEVRIADAVADICLSALAARLCGKAADADQSEAQEVELF